MRKIIQTDVAMQKSSKIKHLHYNFYSLSGVKLLSCCQCDRGLSWLPWRPNAFAQMLGQGGGEAQNACYLAGITLKMARTRKTRHRPSFAQAAMPPRCAVVLKRASEPRRHAAHDRHAAIRSAVWHPSQGRTWKSISCAPLSPSLSKGT
ncbi:MULTISPECIES: hypothetical protein [Chromobacterium]|uniref:hypothetical protein n=1 Tax=Chromobacterium TaxID=535 RepID=UPI0018881CBD|nr:MULTISPECIES: hypothetical protein [Chromobacterium]WON85053.1 hypothetical protein OK026_05990 [Chromobacterium haemolyticum]